MLGEDQRATVEPAPRSQRAGLAPASQDHVFRNQSVGRRWSGAGSGPAVGGRDADQEVVGVRLRVLDDHVEVAALVEDPRVEQLELGIAAPAPAVLLDEPGVRELGLGVLVQARACTEWVGVASR